MQTETVKDVLSEISSLYDQLPTVHCKECGSCCVSPSCTLIEFIYLFTNIKKHLHPDDLAAAITSPVQLHPDYEGNTICNFLFKNSCTVHPFRTGACRLFGIPALKQMNIHEMVYCHHDISVSGNAADIITISLWLDQLVKINSQLHPVCTAPYFLVGLSIDCWLDLYFDTTFTQQFFINIQAVMRSYIDLSQFSNIYKPRTGLHNKIKIIDCFTKNIDNGDAALLKKMLILIRDGFPLTGAYFYEESQAFLQEIEKVAF